MTYRYQPVLKHHGILGMKWGVRRFRNEDGTLTNAGKKKYGKRYEKRQEQIKQYTKFANEYGERSQNYQKQLDKAMKNPSMVNKIYKNAFGNETPESLGYGKASKKEVVKSILEQDITEAKGMQKYYSDKSKVTANTPINKMTRDESNKVAIGATKAAFALNTLGVVTVAALSKKYDGKVNKDLVKGAAYLGGLFTLGSLATNLSISNAVADKREEKILKENRSVAYERL